MKTIRPLNAGRKLTRKQKAFADSLIANPKQSATKAYMGAYNTTRPAIAAVEASRTLQKPNVLIYLNEHVAMAKGKIVDLVSHGKDEVALKASQDILDREFGKAVQRAEIRAEVVSIGIDLTNTTGEDVSQPAG